MYATYMASASQQADTSPINGIDKISLSKLRRALHDVSGPSPSEIIRAARLRLAERLLCETRMMVREIARRADYSSEKHFATKFSATFGCSPTKYRSCKLQPGNPRP